MPSLTINSRSPVSTHLLHGLKRGVKWAMVESLGSFMVLLMFNGSPRILGLAQEGATLRFPWGPSHHHNPHSTSQRTNVAILPNVCHPNYVFWDQRGGHWMDPWDLFWVGSYLKFIWPLTRGRGVIWDLPNSTSVQSQCPELSESSRFSFFSVYSCPCKKLQFP